MRHTPSLRALALLMLGLLVATLPACGGGGSDGGGPGAPQFERPNDADTGAGQGTTPDDVQWHLDWLNTMRVARSLPEFTLKPALNAFALDGVEEYATNSIPHKHFNDAGNGIWTMGFVNNAAENQGRAGGYPSPRAAWDAILQGMMDEEHQYDPGDSRRGHFETLVSTNYTHVGIGIVIVGNSAYLTHDFSGG